MLLSPRIVNENTEGHHNVLLNLYLAKEKEYIDSCKASVDSITELKSALHRFKSALCYVSSDEVLDLLVELENEMIEHNVEWRKEKLLIFFEKLEDLKDSILAYLEEHQK